MKAYFNTAAFILTSFVLILALITCSPKCVVRGRVVDGETRQPIKGAAVAIKWYPDTSAKRSGESETVDAVQALSDEKGLFQIPEYPDRKYILGVYKNGYICWSSRDDFLNQQAVAVQKHYRSRKSPQMNEGMVIELLPFKKEHSRDLHAGFTVMVAGESTIKPDGPFHQAIESEYHLWRENLRKDFQKEIGVK